jgi:hypothetical protein
MAARIAELERTHHSMEDDDGRQYAVIPMDWIDRAWETYIAKKPAGAVFSDIGIVACSECRGDGRATSTQAAKIEQTRHGTCSTCHGHGWVWAGEVKGE